MIVCSEKTEEASTPYEHLFDYEEWSWAPESHHFYNVILKVQIGEYAVGTSFPWAVIDCRYAKLTLFDERLKGRARVPDDKRHEFKLRFEVSGHNNN